MGRDAGNILPHSASVAEFEPECRTRRKLAVQEITARFTTPEAEATIRAMSKAEKQDLAVDLLMAGLSRYDAELILHVQQGSILAWVNRETATMQQKLHEGCSRKALLEFPETFQRLADLRFHPNAETARKASLDMARAAGRGIDAPAPASLTVNMTGQNNQFNLSTRELEEKILGIAEQLGPDAAALAKGELGAKPAGFSIRGGSPENGGAARKADPGETPAA